MSSRWTPGYSCPITLQLVGPHSWTEVPASLGYDPADPYAVRISFGEPAETVAEAPTASRGWSAAS